MHARTHARTINLNNHVTDVDGARLKCWAVGVELCELQNETLIHIQWSSNALTDCTRKASVGECVLGIAGEENSRGWPSSACDSI
jgi:hypothetical protein